MFFICFLQLAILLFSSYLVTDKLLRKRKCQICIIFQICNHITFYFIAVYCSQSVFEHKDIGICLLIIILLKYDRIIVKVMNFDVSNNLIHL